MNHCKARIMGSVGMKGVKESSLGLNGIAKVALTEKNAKVDCL